MSGFILKLLTSPHVVVSFCFSLQVMHACVYTVCVLCIFLGFVCV